MMTLKFFISRVFIMTTLIFGFAFAPKTTDDNAVAEIKAIAEQFVQVVDNNDAETLRSLLHPDMIQYAYLGGNLVPFKGSDFTQMVADKKLGGVTRKVTHKSAEIVRGNTAMVVLNAVSSQYDFMYQLSMAKVADKWIIVGILVDVSKPG